MRSGRTPPMSSAVLRSAIHSHPGNYLAEDYDVEAYYLRAEVPWQRWSSTYYFSYPGALPGAPSYEAAINSHYFSLVILNFGDTAATDSQITADMRHAGGYYVVARAGRFTIWASRVPTPARRSREESCPLLSLRSLSSRRRFTCHGHPTAGKSTGTSASNAAGCSPGCSSRPPGCSTGTSMWPSGPGLSLRSCGCCSWSWCHRSWSTSGCESDIRG